MIPSSRRKAQSWPYPRHNDYEDKLRLSNARWFVARGYAANLRMPYLLENWEDWPKNMILPEVARWIQAEVETRSQGKERFPLHKYLHHGLSSQAMLFNLVGPLIVHENLAPLSQALESAGIPWPAGKVALKFEVEDRRIFNEDSGQPTSIDLVIQGDGSAPALFIEAKLVEREFGGCSVFAAGDCDGRNPARDLGHCYLHHIGRFYWDLLGQHGFLDGPVGTSPICPLAMYYQFFRELLFAIESGGDFVLLYDARNPSFVADGPGGKRGLMPFLIPWVPVALHSRIHWITIQQVVGAYKRHGGLPWLGDFEKKYALIDE
ncbi:MAG: hypothetical protein MUC85_05815 [Anaerolineales bacterium]|jgi:hypothetical protein|nr:hypothetical protein [Anaerolineales bacterium]